MHSNPLLLVAVAVASFATSWILVGAIATFGRRSALLDIPNPRSSHRVPTPRGGGIAISGLTIVGFITLTNGVPIKTLLGFAAASSIVAFISFLDDTQSLNVVSRLTAQVVSALVVILTCGYVSTVSLDGRQIQLGAVGALFTITWIVGLTNGYNFMDGIDGIAASQAAIGGIGWLILGATVREPTFVTTGFLVAATSLGFLLHNWPPARIFMGDVGSAFLGFTFATLPLLSRGDPSAYMIPAALVVWPFLFDTSVTLIRRLRYRENVFAAHRSHLYQRLNIAGYEHRWITTLYATLAAGGAVGAIVYIHVALATRVVILSAIAISATVLWRFVLYVERSARTGAAARGAVNASPDV